MNPRLYAATAVLAQLVMGLTPEEVTANAEALALASVAQADALIDALAAPRATMLRIADELEGEEGEPNGA